MSSLADEPQAGALRAEIARRHDDVGRMAEIDRLIADGHGSEDPRSADDDEMTAASATIPPPARGGRLPGQVTCAVPSCGRDFGARDTTGLCRTHRPLAVAPTPPRPRLVVAKQEQDRPARAEAAPARSEDVAAAVEEERCRAVVARAAPRPATEREEEAVLAVLEAQDEEKTMPKKPAPCPECGARFKHRAGCSKPPRDGAAASAANGVAHAAPAEQPAAAPTEASSFSATGREPDELLAVIAACKAELQRQRDEAAATMRKLEKALEDLAP